MGTDETGTLDKGNTLTGIVAENSTNNTIVGNLVSGNDNWGVVLWLTGTTGNVVRGNTIGLNASGDTALPNSYEGLSIHAGASNNTIGGTNPGDGNVISGNLGRGIQIVDTTTSGNVVQGNTIGLGLDGATPLGNGSDGIAIVHSPGNTIGGSLAGAGNIIAGNTRVGLWIAYVESTGNLVQGNDIGTNPAGDAGLGNGVTTSLAGINLYDAPGNTIGGSVAEARNVLSGNSFGIQISLSNSHGNVVQGNDIGTTPTGDAALQNTQQGLRIDSGAHDNIIGTDGDGKNDASEGNLISGNNFVGVLITGAGTDRNVVAGNRIGTDRDGLAAIPSGGGVRITAGAQSNRIGTDGDGLSDDLERNLVSGNRNSGIRLDAAGTSYNHVAGNWIGVDITGNAALPNAINGVYLYNGATNNWIGTDSNGNADAAERNLISGNVSDGVIIQDAATVDNIVAGNFVGTNADGTAPVPNAADGIYLSGNGNTIGGTAASARNVISGNTGFGIRLDTGTGNLIAGNTIGLNDDGDAPLSNGRDGIVLYVGAHQNTIGGTTASAGNVLSGNNGAGIWLLGGDVWGNPIQGNAIGTDANGTTGLGNGNDGVAIEGAYGNIIGGVVSGAGNLISGNNRNGVFIQRIDRRRQHRPGEHDRHDSRRQRRSRQHGRRRADRSRRERQSDWRHSQRRGEPDRGQRCERHPDHRRRDGQLRPGKRDRRRRQRPAPAQ